MTTLNLIDAVLTGLMGLLARVEAGLERVRQDTLRRAGK